MHQEPPPQDHDRSLLRACADSSVRAHLRLRYDVVRYYRARNLAPRWNDGEALSPLADSLLQVIEEGRQEGIVPDVSHQALEAASHRRLPADSLATLDLQLTDAFFGQVCDRIHGGSCRDSCGAVSVDTAGPAGALLDAFFSSDRPREMLRDLSPRHHAYRGLVAMRRRIGRLLATPSWIPIPGGDTLREGNLGRHVRAIQDRLEFWSDLPRGRSHPGVFDPILTDAVKLFQFRNGVAPTGQVDSATLAVLNISPASRLRQIDINLERWRRTAHDLGDLYVLVNIPDYRLLAVERGRILLTMKVVVGLPLWPTPTFSSRLTTIVFNPYWLSPRRILVAELINYIKADSTYLRSNAMVILRGEGADRREVDPRDIDWATLRPEAIDFQLLQSPGPQNIMGQVKFLAPNPFDVYLHDTPYRDDFRNPARLASHGCIRLERAFEFAAFLLREHPRWASARGDSVVVARQPVTVSLARPIPVHIVYATAWLDTAGCMQFRPDPYGLDVPRPEFAGTPGAGRERSTARRFTP